MVRGLFGARTPQHNSRDTKLLFQLFRATNGVAADVIIEISINALNFLLLNPLCPVPVTLKHITPH